VRFHDAISPESLFYPTASQIETFGRRQVDADKIVVVIGGNSILYGTGQRPDGVWTAKLQELLGDRYQVINFALPGARPAEFGELCAEILECDHPRLVFITDCGSSGIDGNPEGWTYRPFFWDAYYKGMVAPDPERDEALRRAVREEPIAGINAFHDPRLGARMDATLRFQDLWTRIAYNHVSTVWTPRTAATFYWPRCRYSEAPIPPPRVEERYPAAADDQAMRTVRIMICPNVLDGTRGTAEDCALARLMRGCFPEKCRQRTLMLVVRDSPYYVNQLNGDERTLYDRIFADFVRILEAIGMRSIDVGRDYSSSDYFDRCHLSEEGGLRLAADVAPRIQEMAGQLGYLSKGGR
jgi:hypothetical protein